MNSTQQIQRIEDVPIVDLEKFMNQDSKTPEVQDLCKQVADSLHKYGILIVKDPRAQQQHNSDYIDLMEQYFCSRGKKLYAGEELEEAKPQCHYQVGVCPKELEIARNHAERMMKLDEANKPMSPLEPVYDAKWRFMWKIGQRPENASDDFPQVIPQDFPDWEEKMNLWGHKLLDAVHSVAEMAAVGMGLPQNTFLERMDGGAHLLAPTGSDLEKNEVGAVFAGYHYDISFLTIHGKSRYPGLYAWTRENTKLQIKVPEGCLLLQAGKTFEHITGGYVLAGFHEVMYTEQTKAAYEKAKSEGKITWRVSSTMFSTLRYNVDCSPMPELAHLYSKEQAAQYGNLSTYDILMTELDATNMVVHSTGDSSPKQTKGEESAFVMEGSPVKGEDLL